MMYWILIHWHQLKYIFSSNLTFVSMRFSANKQNMFMLQTSLHIVNIGDNAAKIQADKNVIFALWVAKYLHNQKTNMLGFRIRDSILRV